MKLYFQVLLTPKGWGRRATKTPTVDLPLSTGCSQYMPSMCTLRSALNVLFPVVPSLGPLTRTQSPRTLVSWVSHDIEMNVVWVLSHG